MFEEGYTGWLGDYKFYGWARKIEDEVLNMEVNNEPEEDIKEYLENCADIREEFLDPNDLTETEEYYTEKINKNTFGKYEISDPIFDEIFG